ncbi:hypothetical protein GGS21DRAFT_519200 [Xylaria nigripes]|nr:hypothetical protein GGS21DRAFT_519200 [Xylaria nigripes]
MNAHHIDHPLSSPILCDRFDSQLLLILDYSHNIIISAAFVCTFLLLNTQCTLFQHVKPIIISSIINHEYYLPQRSRARPDLAVKQVENLIYGLRQQRSQSLISLGVRKYKPANYAGEYGARLPYGASILDSARHRRDVGCRIECTGQSQGERRSMINGEEGNLRGTENHGPLLPP